MASPVQVPTNVLVPVFSQQIAMFVFIGEELGYAGRGKDIVQKVAFFVLLEKEAMRNNDVEWNRKNGRKFGCVSVLLLSYKRKTAY